MGSRTGKLSIIMTLDALHSMSRNVEKISTYRLIFELDIINIE